MLYQIPSDVLPAVGLLYENINSIPTIENTIKRALQFYYFRRLVLYQDRTCFRVRSIDRKHHPKAVVGPFASLSRLNRVEEDNDVYWIEIKYRILPNAKFPLLEWR